jgi:uncharacterized membrane protein affecting hemolysin expression
MLASRTRSIRSRLTLMNMLISGVTLVLACAAFWVYEMNAVRQSMVRQLSMQAQITGASSASALLFDDAKAAQETLSVLRTEPAILFGGIYRWSGEALAVYGAGSRVMKNQQTALAPGQLEAHWFGPGELSLVRLIVFQGKVVGSVYLLSDLRELDKRLERYGWIVAAVLLLSLIAAFLLSRPLQAGVIGTAGADRFVQRDARADSAPGPCAADLAGAIGAASDAKNGGVG